MNRRPLVAFYQMRLFHYRVALFEHMRRMADAADIDLRVIAGQPSRSASTRKDDASLPWVDTVRNWYLPIEERKDLCWQPSPRDMPRPDLVLVMQENRIISNYPWLVRRRFGGPKLAYWGHGRDLQADNPDSLRNRFKKQLAQGVDWYFAYTDFTREILDRDGFPADRTTVVNNAIDTSGFQADLAAVTPEALAALRTQLGFAASDPIAIYCGSLYEDKKLDLLLHACNQVAARVPGFRLLILGDGPERERLVSAIQGNQVFSYLGAQRGHQKAAAFRLASMLLNPGGVGLHVLDAFAASIPLLTTENSRHGPEIVYLENGRNGLVTADHGDAYADAITRLLQDPTHLRVLGQQAGQDAAAYSVERMASRFVEGIQACLAREHRT